MKIQKEKIAQAYHGGAFFEDIGPDFSDLERKNQIINADVVDAWYDPSPKVTAKLSEYLPWLVRTSPPIYSEGLIRTISQVRGIPPENLITGGGSSDLMYLAFPNLLAKGARVLLLDPMYGEYTHIMENVLPVEPVRNFQSKETSFRVAFESLITNAVDADMIILVNPNNPTGQYVTREFVRNLLEEITSDTLLFIDETYVDYVTPSPSVESWVSRYDNLIVIKSMSKFYALSGARVAYLAASQEIIERLKAFSPPWAVGLLAQVAAVEALSDEKYYRAKVQETHRLRSELSQELSTIAGLKVYDSVANFILMELAHSKKSAAQVYREVREQGVHIRNCDSQSLHFSGKFIRTAVKDSVNNQKIFQALRSVLAQND
ncbi:histidinol-phosphate aminotransferase family protein [Candidatus Acetothermia bacterium]|nr:histidinol-phosphate aminotransferase family protein [Candidatus Acetothermia bacterium]MBI3461277.1 histidinol-phosphate aminotransferase family protein [Candidatus Acetothermia bacterium]MBI3660573.1 histidinol-phosphate aminotransferase family protein [Candidatus Acetothermia bacterium]